MCWPKSTTGDGEIIRLVKKQKRLSTKTRKQQKSFLSKIWRLPPIVIIPRHLRLNLVLKNFFQGAGDGGKGF